MKKSNVIQLFKPKNKLTSKQEYELSWYFGPGMAFSSYSQFGNMLDIARVFSARNQTCNECNGFGFDENSDTCVSCNGCGVTRSKRNIKKREINVFPKSKKSVEPSYSMETNEDSFMKSASISRKLYYVSDKSLRILNAYYGDIGIKWSKTNKRIYSILPLTTSGIQMIRLALENKMPEAEVSNDKAILNLIRYFSKPEKRKTSLGKEMFRLLAQAETEAIKSLDCAVDEYLAISNKGNVKGT